MLTSNQLRLVSNDTLPILRGTLTEDDGTPVDLTDAVVTFHLKYPIPLVKPTVIASPLTGVWAMSWDLADLQPGTFRYEIQVVYGTGGIRTWNRETDTDEYLEMVIDPEIA